MFNPLPPEHPFDDFFLLAMPVRWNEHRHRLADNLLGSIAVEEPTTAAPSGYNAIQVLAQNYIVGSLDNCCQTPLLLLGLLALRDVDQRIDGASKRTCFVPYWR